MITIDLYVFRQILRPLAGALLVALLVLLIERMLRLLDFVLGANGPVEVVFEILGYLVPHYMALALPISLYLGILLGFNRLSQDGELDAFQSAGIGLGRLARAAFCIAFLVTLIAAVLFSHLRPYSRYAYQSVVFVISNTSLQAFLRAGVFTEIEDTTFLVEGIHPDGVRFSKVFVYERKADGKQVVVTARDGGLNTASGDKEPLLHLYDGVRLELDAPQAAAPDAAPASLGLLRFEELRTSLGIDTTRLFRARGKDEREFTLFELWERRFDPPPGVGSSDMLAEFHGRIVRVLSIPFLPFLAIPLALGRRRSDRSYGIVVGMLLLVVYHQVLDLLENMAEAQVIEPALALWAPFLVYAVGSVLLFRRVSTRVPGALSIDPLAPLVRMAGALVPSLASRKKESG
jgi:lipopolysaccharide export system permease protein